MSVKHTLKTPGMVEQTTTFGELRDGDETIDYYDALVGTWMQLPGRVVGTTLHLGGMTASLTHAIQLWGRGTAVRVLRVAPAPTRDPRFPHDCPRCGAPAYVGVVPAALDCTRGCSP